jgi:hypothetical protein
MKTITTVLAVGTALFTSASPASADDAKPAPKSSDAHVTAAQTDDISPAFTPSFAASRAGTSVDIWPTKNNLSATFGAELQVQLAPKLLLDLSYSAAFAHVGDAIDASDNLGFGNPTIGLHFASSPTHELSYFAGISVTAPLLHDPSQEVRNAAFYGQRIRGYYDADRFALGHMAARVSIGMELQGARPLIVRGEIRPVVYIPTSDEHPAFPEDRTGFPGADDGDTVVTVEHAMELEMRTDMGVGVGMRFQGVIMPTREDMIQTVAEPFIQFTPQRKGIYARLGLPVAIDEDLGFGLTEEDKLAAIRVNIGAEW